MTIVVLQPGFIVIKKKKKNCVFCFPVPVLIAPTSMGHLLATAFTKLDTEQVESEHLQHWGC